MESNRTWKNERNELIDFYPKNEDHNVLLDEGYKKQIAKLSDTEGSFLYQMKTSAAEEAGVDPQTFINDFCNAICKETHYGNACVIIPPIPESVGSWVIDVETAIEKQKKTIQQGEEYDIPSFKEYLFSYYEVKEIIQEGDYDKRNEIIRGLPNYDSDKIVDFLEKHGIDILKELENKDLLFYSYDIIPYIYLETNFLMVTPEDQKGDSLWGENFIKKFNDCVNGEALPPEEEIRKSGLGQLLDQQGYTFADLVQTKGPIHSDIDPVFVKTSPFLNSLRDELFDIISENEKVGGVFTLCGTMSITDFYLTLKNPENKLVFDEKTFAGIHDPQDGKMNHFALSFEKPVVLPIKDCILMVEDTEETFHFLNTVGSVYNVPEKAWEHKPQITAPDKELSFVNLEKTVRKQPRMK